MGRIIGGVNFKEKRCSIIENILSEMAAPFQWSSREDFKKEFLQVLRYAPPAERSSCSFEGQDSFLLLDGQIFIDKESGIEQEISTGQVALADRLISIYNRKGPEYLCGLNGMYLIVVWDAVTETLFIVNDIMGLKPCYYWFSDGTLMLGTQYEFMTRHPDFRKEVDSRALVDLMTMGCMLEDRTLFSDVKCLQPGSLLSCDKHGIKTRKIKQLQENDARWATPFSLLIEEMAEHLDNAVNVRLRGAGNILLPLSGGLDSRVMVGFCCRHSSDITTMTFGDKKHNDAKIALRVANKLGLRHIFYQHGADFLLKNADIHLSATESSAEPFTSYIAAVLMRSQGNYHDIVHGYLGDCLHGDNYTIMRKWMQKYGLEPADAMYSYYARRFPPKVLESYLADRLKVSICSPRDSLKSFFESLDGSLLYKCLVTDFNFRNRHYLSSQLNILEDCARVHAPFTDLNYINFILSLPPAVFDNKNLYKKMISTIFPELAYLVNTNTGWPLTLSIKSIVHRLLLSAENGIDMLMEYAQAFGTQEKGLQKKTNMWDTFSNVEESYRIQCGEIVRELYEHLETFFNIDAVDKIFFSESKDTPRALGVKVRRIYGFALWLKKYFT